MTTQELREYKRKKQRIYRLEHPNAWAEYYQKNKKRLKAKAITRRRSNVKLARKKDRAWYAKNRKKILARIKVAYQKSVRHVEFVKRVKFHASKAYKAQQIIAARKRASLWSKEHPEIVNLRNAEWAKRNRPKVNAKAANRRFIKAKACPSWVDKKAICRVYEIARLMTNKTGITYHVDHIWPLRNKNFTGLHVPWNLQILTAHDNLTKSNKAPTCL